MYHTGLYIHLLEELYVGVALVYRRRLLQEYLEHYRDSQYQRRPAWRIRRWTRYSWFIEEIITGWTSVPRVSLHVILPWQTSRPTFGSYSRMTGITFTTRHIRLDCIWWCCCILGYQLDRLNMWWIYNTMLVVSPWIAKVYYTNYSRYAFVPSLV